MMEHVRTPGTLFSPPDYEDVSALWSAVRKAELAGDETVAQKLARCAYALDQIRERLGLPGSLARGDC